MSGPVEYILTLLPTLSYFIANDGIEVVVSNLLAPALALLNIATPVVGPLIDDLITKYLGEYLDILDLEGVKTVEVQKVDDNGQPVFDENDQPVMVTKKVYSIKDVLGIAGDDGSNLVKLLNKVLGTVILMVKDGTAFSFDAVKEFNAFQILPETFFSDYAQHTITIGKKTADSKVYYMLENAETGKTLKVEQAVYNMNQAAYAGYTVKTTRYVVKDFKADIADSLVYLLDNVLSEELLNQVSGIIEAKMEAGEVRDAISGILNGIVNSADNGLRVSEIIAALFEGYTVSYAEWINRYIETDHSDYDELSAELKPQVTAIPQKLDNVLNAAVPVLKNLLPTLLEGKEVADTLQQIIDAMADLSDEATLKDLVDKLLGELIINDKLGSIIYDLLVGLLAGLDPKLINTINTILPILGIKLDLTPKGIKAIADDTENGIPGLSAYLGEVNDETTWADIAAKYTKYGYTYVIPGEGDAEDKTVEYYGAAGETSITIGEGENEQTYALTPKMTDGDEPTQVTKVDSTAQADTFGWNIDEISDIIDVVGPILDPFSDLLKVVFQGKTLTVINKGDAYVPVLTEDYTANATNGLVDVTTEPDDSRDGNEIGYGYIEIRGSRGYEQAIVPLLEALGLRTDSAEGAIISQADFNAKTTASDMLRYLIAEIEAILTNLENAPVSFLAKNLASLIYFVANDGVSTLIDSALAFVYALLAVVKDFYDIQLGDFIDLFYTVKLEDTKTGKYDAENHEIVKKGLLSTINGLLADNDVNFSLTREMIYELAGKLGEFETYATVRSTAMSYLVTTDNQTVDATGAACEGEPQKVTSIVGKPEYFLPGLLGFVLDSTEIKTLILGLIPDADPNDESAINIKEIVEGILNNPTGVEGILTLLAKLFNKYIVTYLAIEEPVELLKLEREPIPYYDETPGADNYDNRTVTKEQTEGAIATLDKLLDAILPLFIEDYDSEAGLAGLIGGLLYNNDTISSIFDMLVNALGGLDSWDTITMVLSIVKQVTGFDIQLSPKAFLDNAPELKAYFGKEGDPDAAWVTDETTWSDIAELYTAYGYTYTKDGKTEEYFGEAGLTEAEIDGETYAVTPKMTEGDNPTQVTKALSVGKVDWNIDDAEDLINFVCNLLTPLNPILAVILGGGTNDGNAENVKAISALREININGGSGYNYAILPLLEMFGITEVNGAPLKTQDEYNTLIENESPLKYILTAVFSLLDEDNLDAPVSFILKKLANIAYYISQDGLTNIVANLIAPVSEIIRSIEDVLPIALVVDIPAALDDDDTTDVVKFLLGDEQVGEYDVGLTIDLNGDTLEALIAGLLDKFVPQLDITIDFAKLAGQCADADGDGVIAYTASKVDIGWDHLKWFENEPNWIRNISGDAADTLIALIETVVTKENVQAILDMVNLDLSTLPEEVANIINRLLEDPDLLVDTIIKLLSGADYNVETIPMHFKYLGTLDYNYETDAHGLTGTDREPWVDAAIDKLDAILNRAVPKVIELLADQEEAPEIITKIVEGLEGEDATIENIVNYFLNDFVFKDDLVNTIMSALVGVLGGMEDSTFNTIQKVVKELLNIDISIAGIKTTLGTDSKIGTFIGDAESWAALAERYTEGEGEDAKVVVDYDGWAVTDKASFMTVIDELLTVVDPLLEWLLNGQDIVLFVDELKLKGGNAYSGAIVPLAKALGIAIDPAAATGVAMVDSLVDGLFGLIDKIETKPVTTILEILGNLSYLIANDGVATVIKNLISPITGLLTIFNSIITDEDIDALLKKYVVINGTGYGLTDIINIAGPKGEKLIALLNELLSGLTATSESQEVIVTNYLDENFFVTLCKYAIEYVTPSISDDQKVPDPTAAQQEAIGDITKWTVDASDVLMYILSTVCTNDFLQFIIDVAKLKAPEDPTAINPVDIILGLAKEGTPNELVDLIIMLLTKYEMSYMRIPQDPTISKIAVETKGTATKDEIGTALTALDGLIPVVLGLFTDAGSLSELLLGLLDNTDDNGKDLANLLLNLIVPLLAGLEDGSIDLATILGYVEEFAGIHVDLNPAAFATGPLASFLGDAESWSAIANANMKFAYTYSYTDADGDVQTGDYYDTEAGKTSGTITVNGEPQAVTLTAVMTEGDEPEQVEKVYITEDFGIDTFAKLVDFLTAALKPLDFIFAILLDGEDIVILEDQPHQNEDGKYKYTYMTDDGEIKEYYGDSTDLVTAEIDGETYEITLYKAEIRITGGNGFNYAIVPLLEAFGIEISQTAYRADVTSTGSHIHYILTKLVGLIEEISAAPISTLLEKLANIFYFIGSDGINTVVYNLLRPVNALAEQIDDVIPLAVNIDIDKLLVPGAGFSDILGLYIGKEHTCPAGVTVDLAASKLTAVINNFISEIKINDDITLNLALDLDWNEIAAKMALVENYPDEQNTDDAALKKTESAMVYADTDQNKAAVPGPHKNIYGDMTDTFLTLLGAILTDNNKAQIVNLVKGLLPEDMNADAKAVINEVLDNPNAIDNLIVDVILLLNQHGEPVPESEYLGFVYKFLGTLAGFAVKDGVADAIVSFDKVINKAAPVVLTFIPEDTENPDSIINKIKGSDADSLAGIVDDLLANVVFTDEMMETITDLILPILGNTLSADLVKSINNLTKIDLTPAAFLAAFEDRADLATYANQLSAYIGDATSWTKVVELNSTETADGVDCAPIFSGFEGDSAQNDFVEVLLTLITPLEPVLAFLLTGGTLSIYAGDTAALTLGGGKGYAKSLEQLLVNGLGLHEAYFGGAEVTGEADSAINALRNIINMVLNNLLPKLKEAPITTVLKILGNLAFFIVNNDLTPAISNLIAPVDALLGNFNDVITRDQINRLLKAFIGLGLDDIIHIGDNQGKNLIDFINKYLKVTLRDDEDNEIMVVGALPDDFFVKLSQACIKNDDPSGDVAVGTDLTQWHVEVDAALMFILETALTQDMLAAIAELAGMDKDSDIYDIVMGLEGKTDEVVDILVMLLKKYLVSFTAYNEQKLTKSAADGTDNDLTTEQHDKLTTALEGIDGLIPVILGFIPSIEADNLKDLVYGLLTNADLPNTLMNLIVPLLANVDSLGIDLNQILGYVNDLTSLHIESIAPKAFADGAAFGSKLPNFINSFGNPDVTWSDIAAEYTRYVYTATVDGEELTWYDTVSQATRTVDGVTYTKKLDDNGEHATAVRIDYDWGINDLQGLVNLVCDFLMPLNDVVAILLMGGTDRDTFVNTGVHNGAKITAFDDINIMGGNGYNYAIIQLLELLGVAAKTQSEYEEAVDAASGSPLYPILTDLVARVDEILDAPIANVLDIFANLCYVIGMDNLEVIIANILAPVNTIIEKVDGLYPIALRVDLGELLAGGEAVENLIGKPHPGVPAGISIALKSTDINNLITNLLASIKVGDNDEALGISIDLDWIGMATQAAADTNHDNEADKVQSKLDPKYDNYLIVNPDDKNTTGSNMWNVVGDKANTIETLLDKLLTRDNIDAILKLIGKEDGFGEPIDSIIDSIIDDPTQLIDLLLTLLGAEPNMIPEQNMKVQGVLGFDYRPYLTLTKSNADVMAAQLDGVIQRIMTTAGVGSLKEFVGSNFITNEIVSKLVDTIFGLLGNGTVDPILEVVAGLEGDVENPRLDLTVDRFYEVYQQNGFTAGARLLRNAETWADVGSAAGVNWGFRDGNVKGFAEALSNILAPLAGLLKLLLIGDGDSLKLFDFIEIKGSNGYDYAIIPLLEALGFSAAQVKTLDQYKAYVAQSDKNVLGYILEKVAELVDTILTTPVDTLLGLLPNFAYFLSGQGLYIAVADLLAPVFKIVKLVASVFKVNEVELIKFLQLDKALNLIDFGIEILEQKYDFRIPEIDFYKLAIQGAEGTQEVATSRTQEANSFATLLKVSEIGEVGGTTGYINTYPDGYEGRAQKTTQTKIIADKGDTLTLVLTWLVKMFGTEGNKQALANWLSDVFDLTEGGGAEQTVSNAVFELFGALDANHVAEYIISALFQLFGVGLVVDAVYNGNLDTAKLILQRLFKGLAEGPDTCIYAGIADAMQAITGVWKQTVGTDEEYHEAVEEAHESLNWFQRLIKAIRDFFKKLFSFGR